MMISHPDTLLIFDYSGTLSLEAPRFGQPESLLRARAESGLAALGVTSSEIFWEKIVNPTWVEGSTTPAGYKRVMAERIAALRLSPGASAEEITAAASRFVDRYLDHSRIETDWRPLLERLSETPDVTVIVATDHYAEATGRIISEFAAWGIPAAKIGMATACSSVCEPGALPCRRPFLIANSADIGFWKGDAGFWKSLKAALHQDKVTRLLVIDDFGFNEAAGDGYGGEAAKIARRREQTRASLREVFGVEAEIILFSLAAKEEDHPEGRARLIAETALRIESFLERR
jgi:hypothetical protein